MVLLVPLLAAVVIASAAPDGPGGEATGGAPTAPGPEPDPASPPLDRSGESLLGSAVILLWGAASIAIVVGTRGWRPGALDGPAWRPTAPIGLAAAVVIVGAGVLGDAAGAFAWPAALGGGGATARSIGAAALQLTACGVVLLLRRSIFQRSHGHPSSPWWSALGGVVGLAVAWPLVQIAMRLGSWLSSMIAGTPEPELAHESLRELQETGSAVRMATIAVIAVVAAPIVEEVLYRGVIQQMLRSAGLGRRASIAGCAALFSLMHLGDGAVTAASAGAALPALFLLGVLFGVLFERTGRLSAPIAAHALFNAVNVAVLRWHASPTLSTP